MEGKRKAAFLLTFLQFFHMTDSCLSSNDNINMTANGSKEQFPRALLVIAAV